MKILVRSQGTKDWQMVDSVSYREEADLQHLLAESPSLIPVDEIREGTSPFVVAIREFGLPGSGSTDILAFNADGSIAIVECKLAANPEIKRKVIGQILEYGAFLWGMGYQEVDQRVNDKIGKSLADLVAEALDPGIASDWDEERFRAGVEKTLKSGAFALIIAVDEINDEMSQTVKFLNGCGSPAFSFNALEMRRLKTSNMEILVPHLHGPSPASTKTTAARRKWTERDFFQELQAQHSSDIAVAQTILEWAIKKTTKIWWGEGIRNGSFVSVLRHGDTNHQLFAVWTSGAVEIYFYWYQFKPPFDAEAKRLEILDKLNAIPGIFFPKSVITLRPNIRLSALKEPAVLQQFLSVFDWVIKTIEST